MKRDGTRAETRFGLSAKRTSTFKLVGASVQSTTGSRGVRISGSNGSNAGYTMFCGRVQDYWLPTPLACFPFTSPYRASPCAIRFQLSYTCISVTSSRVLHLIIFPSQNANHSHDIQCLARLCVCCVPLKHLTSVLPGTVVIVLIISKTPT